MRDDPDVRRWLDATAQEAGVDAGDREAIVATLRRWIAEDRKATPLKALQGMIWEAGYRDGVYQAHVYPEVADQTPVPPTPGGDRVGALGAVDIDDPVAREARLVSGNTPSVSGRPFWSARTRWPGRAP